MWCVWEKILFIFIYEYPVTHHHYWKGCPSSTLNGVICIINHNSFGGRPVSKFPATSSICFSFSEYCIVLITVHLWYVLISTIVNLPTLFFYKGFMVIFGLCHFHICFRDSWSKPKTLVLEKYTNTLIHRANFFLENGKPDKRIMIMKKCLSWTPILNFKIKFATTISGKSYLKCGSDWHSHMWTGHQYFCVSVLYFAIFAYYS